MMPLFSRTPWLSIRPVLVSTEKVPLGSATSASVAKAGVQTRPARSVPQSPCSPTKDCLSKKVVALAFVPVPALKPFSSLNSTALPPPISSLPLNMMDPGLAKCVRDGPPPFKPTPPQTDPEILTEDWAYAGLAEAATTTQVTTHLFITKLLCSLLSTRTDGHEPAPDRRRPGRRTRACQSDRPGCPSDSRETGLADESTSVEVGVAQRHLNGGQPLEIMGDGHFVGHAHAAVHLDGLLADELQRLAHAHLGGRDQFAALIRRG